MAGNSNFPTALDDDSSLGDVTDGVNTLQAAHHNNIKEAIKVIESKVGIYGTSSPTTLDYRVGHPTGSHKHDGASGQGQPISASSLSYATGAGNPHRRLYQTFRTGSIPSGVNRAAVPIAPDMGFDQTLESVVAVLSKPASGATTILDINFGPTSIWQATQANRLMFAPGATKVTKTSFNHPTYQDGIGITVDADVVGSSAPGEDLSLIFVFRDN